MKIYIYIYIYIYTHVNNSVLVFLNKGAFPDYYPSYYLVSGVFKDGLRMFNK